MTKKIIAGIMAAGMVVLGAFTGCGSGDDWQPDDGTIGLTLSETPDEIKPVSEMSYEEKMFLPAEYLFTKDAKCEYIGKTPQELNELTPGFIDIEKYNNTVEVSQKTGKSDWVFSRAYIDNTNSLFYGRFKTRDAVKVTRELTFCSKCEKLRDVSYEFKMRFDEFDNVKEYFANILGFHRDYEHNTNEKGWEWSSANGDYNTKLIVYYNYDKNIATIKIDDREIYCSCGVHYGSGSPDKSDGVIGDNDGNGIIDENDFMEEWNNYLDKNMPK